MYKSSIKTSEKMIQAANRTKEINEYYFSTKLKEIAQLNCEGKQVINLGIGDPDIAPSQSVWKSLKQASLHSNSHSYQSYIGLPELRTAFAQWYLNYFGVELQAQDEILPLHGSKEGIIITSLAYMNENDSVLIPDPAYPTYTSVSKLLNSNIIYYSLKEENNWEPNFEALEKMDLSKVKIMWVNYPHMPTGAKGSINLFKRIVDFAKRHQILIINDNPYSFILNDPPISIFTVEGAKDCCLELNSLSKSHNMPGWRVGMIAGKKQLLEPILKVKTNMDSGMFYPVQKAAIEALKADRKWYQQINKIYQNRKLLAIKLLEKINCVPVKNQVGMFIWASIPDCFEDSYILSNQILNSHQVFITPGGIFGKEGNRYIRISLCSNEEKIQEAIDRIQQISVH
jgi:aspartate/methionine/tyrosine aminotransferase